MIYVDPSVLFSLYCVDSNSEMALELVGQANESLAVTPFSELETLNAISLSVFRGYVTAQQASRIRAVFESDLATELYRICPFPAGAFARARILAETITPGIGVRSADLLHVATARELGTSAFLTLDRRQQRAAQVAGLSVNPLP